MKSNKTSATHLCATYATKEAGKSNAKRADFLQAFKLLKDQHRKSSKVNPSLLLKLWSECKRPRAKNKKK